MPIVIHPILLIPVVLLFVGCGTTLRHQWIHRAPLPVSPFQQDVAQALGTSKDALLLAPPDALLLQGSTGVAVLADVATPSLISYVPEIGPAIDTMYQDIYGYGFQRPTSPPPATTPWEVLWKQRTASDWETLASTYGFTHVVVPADWALDLHRELAEDDYALYAVHTP